MEKQENPQCDAQDLCKLFKKIALRGNAHLKEEIRFLRGELKRSQQLVSQVLQKTSQEIATEPEIATKRQKLQHAAATGQAQEIAQTEPDHTATIQNVQTDTTDQAVEEAEIMQEITTAVGEFLKPVAEDDSRADLTALGDADMISRQQN